MADKKNEGKAAKDKAPPKGGKDGKDGGSAKPAPKDIAKAKEAKAAKSKQAEADKAAAAQPPKPRDPNYVARLKTHYAKSAVPALTKRFSYKNPMMVPRLQKVVINMGLGAAVGNPKIIDSAVEDMRAISGQKPVVTRARKSIATYKLREGLPIGVMVTLRAERMWEFVDRLIAFSLPRVRDFKGVSPKGFDGKGNFTMGM